MTLRVLAICMLAALPGLCGDWSARLAADYLDSRQKAWFAWPRANQREGGPCLSCHTGVPYLLARPALSRALGEEDGGPWVEGLLNAVRRRVGQRTASEFALGAKEPAASQALGSEAVLSALLLSVDDSRRGKLSRETDQAFERLWSLQRASGEGAEPWHWNSFDLDPWEEPDSEFFGASMAALAVGAAAGDYQSRPQIGANLTALKSYLAARQRTQPLHNRLALVWASTRLRGALSDRERTAIVDEVWRRQAADGGWTVESLGAWGPHPKAPPAEGSSGYATGLTAFVLRQAGVPAVDVRLKRALGWLRTHQDARHGFWDAESMNKRHEPGSMPADFMRDAATAFAALALVDAR